MYFIFDNQCSHRLAKGLALLEEGNKRSPIQCTIKHVSELIPGSSTDEEVIIEAGKRSAIIITYDRDFKELRNHAKLYKEHNCGVVFFRSYKNVLIYWEIVLSFINRWEEIKEMCKNRKRPFVLEVSKRGVSELHF